MTPIQSAQIHLQDVPLLQGLHPSQLRVIEGYIQEKKYSKGEILFFEGKACERIFILRSGRVKVVRNSHAGREQILEVLNAGDTCACHPGNPHWSCSSSAQAITDCVLWILPRDKYVQMVKANSQLAQSLNQVFADRLQKFCCLIQEVTLSDPRQRLVKFILDIAKENKQGIHSVAPIDLPFTHEEIAQRLGLVRETVTRHLQQLKKSKLIGLPPRQVVILNRKGLEAILA